MPSYAGCIGQNMARRFCPQAHPQSLPRAGGLPWQRPQPQAVESPLQQLLKVAHAQGGTLSEAQIALHTGLSPAEIKPVLQEAMRLGYADVVNDPDTGAIRYVFDV
jgi:hypothetical protein